MRAARTGAAGAAVARLLTRLPSAAVHVTLAAGAPAARTDTSAQAGAAVTPVRTPPPGFATT